MVIVPVGCVDDGAARARAWKAADAARRFINIIAELIQPQRNARVATMPGGANTASPTQRGISMKQDKIAENWPQIKLQVMAQFSELTEQDLSASRVDSQYLCKKLEERGEDPRQAKRAVEDFTRTLN